ncbi:MAG: TIGR02679 family protein [Acidimicrobiaceae bacterium]|nr:TIGR02679 family protein [Acidimicrobiaceae bacterium]
MTHNRIPESLKQPGLTPVWRVAREKLDRWGSDRRGTVACPALDPGSVLTLQSLLGRKPTKRLDLTELEAALTTRRIGDNLCSALTRLGCPPSQDAARRRTKRARSEAARATLQEAISSWDEPWATAWSDNIVRAGLLKNADSDAVKVLVTDVRRLLDRLDRLELQGISRTELAASLYGSAHALDRGTKRATAVRHALRHKMLAPPTGDSPTEREEQQRDVDSYGCEVDAVPLVDTPRTERELWETAGILSDRVSAPVLTWAIPASGSSALAKQIRTALQGMLPVHLNLMSLLKYPVTVPQGTAVLVVENPRMVEAAAERNLPSCVVSSNGNPTTAVTTLLRQLQDSGASLWYHGDFDAAGIAICRRMHELGCIPWKMSARDYEHAIHLAEKADVQLETDQSDCSPTPWDPALREIFEHRRLVVHEEFVLNMVLNEFCDHSPADDWQSILCS